MKRLLLGTLLVPCMALGGIVASKPTIPGHKFQLDIEQHLTDTNGLLLLQQVIDVSIGKMVKVYRADGFCYTGKVTEIQEEPGIYKVFGEFNNVENVQFGIVLAKGGIVAGAIVDSKTQKNYVLEFSQAHKGFVFQYSTKYDKPSS